MDDAPKVVKDLDYFLRFNFAKADGVTHLSLVQRGVSGGRIGREELDRIREHPAATEITLSGLKQDTFEYFIANYAQQFKAIHFWKCPLVSDLAPLESLPGLEYVVWFWNQRAERLWDVSKNTSLRGFAFEDFTRLHDLSRIQEAPALEELNFGDKIWSTYVLGSLGPVGECAGLKRLTFSAKKIVDGRIEPLARLTRLEHIDFPANLFTTEQVAWLKAHLPEGIDSSVLSAYRKLRQPLPWKGKTKDVLVIGKRKPFLDSTIDKARLERYVAEFDAMHRWFLEHPAARVEEYGG